MRRLFMLILVTVTWHLNVAHADLISLSVFPSGGLCMMNPPLATPFSVYVVHDFSNGARGSKWKIDDSSGLIHLSDTPMPGSTNLGDPYSGVEMDYGACETSSFMIWQLSFLWFGTQLTGCHHLRVVPFPGETNVIVTDCASATSAAGAGYFTFGPGFIACDNCDQATEPSTWGRVKALYR